MVLDYLPSHFIAGVEQGGPLSAEGRIARFQDIWTNPLRNVNVKEGSMVVRLLQYG